MGEKTVKLSIDNPNCTTVYLNCIKCTNTVEKGALV